MKEFPKSIMTLNSSVICVDESYQRKVKQSEIKAILKSFNPNVANMPKVSFRDGKYWVFDGQHTIVARETMNNNKPVQIECIVFTGMTQRDEKELFKLQVGTSSRPTSLDNFRADLNFKEPYAIQIVSTLELLGLEISMNGSTGDGKLACVSTVIKAYNQLPLGKFADVFDIIKSAWGGKCESLDNRIISGMVKFVKVYDSFNKREMADRLRKEDPVSLLTKAKLAGGGDQTMARIYLGIYNSKRSTRKLEDKL